MEHILDILKERGFLAQMTFEDELFKNIDAGIRLREDLDLPKGLNEIEIREKLTSIEKTLKTLVSAVEKNAK